MVVYECQHVVGKRIGNKIIPVTLIERLFVLQVIKKYYNHEKKENNTGPYVCNKCNKEFSRKYNLDRHELACFIDVIEDNSLPLNSVNLKKLLEKVDSSDVAEKISGGINIYQINNINNITNNITINDFYNTDTEHLSDHDYINCLKQSSGSVRTLLDITHFNPEKPENHNVCITNINSKYLFIHDGNDWKMADQKDVIDDIIDKSNCILDIKSEEFSKQNLRIKLFQNIKNM